MSALSEQCNELRYMAKRLYGIMPYTAERINDAVDTIDHLRNMVESLWPKACITMSETCVDTWIAELRELGVEVSSDGKD